MCTARAVTQAIAYTRPRCTRPRADHPAPLQPSSSFRATTRRRPHYQLPHGVPQKSPYTHAHARQKDNHEPPFGAIAQFMDGGPRHRAIDMTSRAGSAISSHLFPTRLVMPFSLSIVVMIGSFETPGYVDPGTHA